MKKAGIICSILFFNLTLYAQSSKDSLYAVWKDEKQHDTIRFKAIKSFIWENYLFSRPDTAYTIAAEQLSYAVKRKNLLKQADAYNTMGISWYFRSEFDSALYNYEKGFELVKQVGNVKAAPAFLNNIGTIEMARGNYAVAIEKFNQGLKIEVLKGNKLGAANCHLNIGIIYYRQGDYDRAREHYRLAGDFYKDAGNEVSLANTLNNLGVMENELGNRQEAIKYHEEAYALRKKNNDQLGMGVSLGNLASVYMDLGDYERALPSVFEALKNAEEMQDMVTVSSCYFNIANIYLSQNRLDDCIQMAGKSYEIAAAVGAINEEKQAAQILYEAHKRRAEFKKSLEMYEVFTSLKDSITSDENKSAIIRQEYKAEYEKMAVADSLKSIEEKKLQQAELQTERAENNRRQQFSVFLIIGLIAALIFGFIIYKRLRITREQKTIIEEQKITVTNAFDQLEEKNKEILDSITYAKRIQNAILPSQKIISRTFRDSFVLYKPKDIVAGDFYFFEIQDDRAIFAAADCTGHGVPGALVSVICNNALNRSVREFGLTDAAQILNKTREIVIAEFEKSDENVKDGMDISLCSLSLSALTLAWAGANNPLWILRKTNSQSGNADASFETPTGITQNNGYQLTGVKPDSSAETPGRISQNNGFQLIEVKADKQPIGKFSEAKPFTGHQIQLMPGDCIYIFTDGFQDQFGGEKGKKFKASSLRELIQEVGSLPMKEQHSKIQNTFEDWRGNLEQIDDVCIIGIRV